MTPATLIEPVKFAGLSRTVWAALITNPTGVKRSAVDNARGGFR